MSDIAFRPRLVRLASLALIPAAFAVSIFTPPAAEAGERGVLVLAEDGAGFDRFEGAPMLADTGCALWRHGEIASHRGTMPMGGARAFALLDCAADPLETPDSRAALVEALGLDAAPVMLEGRFREREAAFASMSEAASRRYVIRLGEFNNIDPDGRQRGRADFFEAASLRAYAFSTEAVIDIESAVGMPTPDTVEVFYYPDAEASAGFARENRDLVTRSYFYNDRHFERFAYLRARAPGETPAPSLQADAGEAWAFVLTSESLEVDAPHARWRLRQRILGESEPVDILLMRASDAEGLAPETARVLTGVMPVGRNLRFDPNRFYTLALAWFDPENPGDYTRYLDTVAEDVADVGGRFLIRMRDPSATGHPVPQGAPDQVTLVEWDSAESLQALLARDSYQAARPLLASGARYFEFLSMEAQAGR